MTSNVSSVSTAVKAESATTQINKILGEMRGSINLQPAHTPLNKATSASVAKIVDFARRGGA